MGSQRLGVMGQVALAVGAVTLIVCVLRLGGRGDIAFCREVFTGLANGKTSVRSAIDWEHLNAINVDVGATYQQLPQGEDRSRYQEVFIQNFSAAFQRAGGRPSAFRRWRVSAHQGGRTVVAADYPAKQKTLLFTVSTASGRHIEAIQWGADGR